MLGTVLGRFRLVSAIEGLSYLILVFIAMPIKYLGDNPIYVKIFGMAHGVLFILFMVVFFQAKIKDNWNNKLALEIFVLSLIPFGAILIEKKIKAREIR